MEEEVEEAVSDPPATPFILLAPLEVLDVIALPLPGEEELPAAKLFLISSRFAKALDASCRAVSISSNRLELDAVVLFAAAVLTAARVGDRPCCNALKVEFSPARVNKEVLATAVGLLWANSADVGS